jgi:hypothetical protein
MGIKILVLFAALSFPLGGAGDAALDRATLRGVTAVHVVIDPVASEIEKEGATANELRSRLEQRLSAAGIKIDPASTEFVALRVTGVQGPKGKLAMRPPFAIATSIALYQPVTLVRDRNVKTATQTWEVETVVLADAKQVDQACLDSVDELAGRFVTAYRAVNR